MSDSEIQFGVVVWKEDDNNKRPRLTVLFDYTDGSLWETLINTYQTFRTVDDICIRAQVGENGVVQYWVDHKDDKGKIDSLAGYLRRQLEGRGYQIIVKP